MVKVDIFKAYDTIDWAYIRVILMKVVLPIRIIRWIMACISTANYAIIINGVPTTFFSAGRGLRQGCALSPLIFILIMDGLSRLLREAVSQGHTMGF